MKSIFYSMLLICFCISANAQIVTMEEAQSGASKFMSRELSKEVTCKAYNSSKGADNMFYVFTTKDDNTFMFVSKTKKAFPVIAYSTESGFDENNLPPAVELYISLINKQLADIESKDWDFDQSLSDAWDLFLTKGDEPELRHAISPIVQTKWNQDCYYNALAPEDPSALAPCGRCYAGCVATAMGQVMKYHNYPEHGIGSSQYTHNVYGTLSANYGAATYQWDSMPNSLSSSSTEGKINAVATLLYHLGVSVQMGYAPDGSGASSTVSASSLVNYFGYSSYSDEVERSTFTDDVWVDMIANELYSGRPLVYRGSAEDGSGGHAFVCDGVNSANKLHFNFGWSGTSDAYFNVTQIRPNYDFTGYQSAIMFLEPAELEEGESYCNEMTTLTAASDTVNDGSGDKRYASDSYCKWYIHPDNVGKIVIKFTEFNMDKDASFLYVYAGNSTSGTPVATLTGYDLPEDITIWGDDALVVFDADFLRGDGFTFVYSTVVAGIEEAWNNNNISVFPVPANDKLTVNFNGAISEQIRSIEILNVLGQSLMMNNDVQANNDFDVSSLKKGVYFIKFVGDNDETLVKRIEID